MNKIVMNNRKELGISKFKTQLMGMSALLVWYYHCGLAASEIPVIKYAAKIIKLRGYLGVDIFLILSGLGLYYRFRRAPVNSFRDYLIYMEGRLKRLFSTYIPITVIIAYDRCWTFREFLGRVTTCSMLTEFIFDYLWYALCILLLYLAAPFLYKSIFSGPNMFFKLFLTFFLIYTTEYFIQNHLRYDLTIIVLKIPVFIVGMLFGQLEYEKKWHQRSALAISLVFLIIAAVSETSLFPIVFIEQENIYNLFYAIPLVIISASVLSLLSGAGSRPFMSIAKLPNKILLLYGTISWEFYCIHEWLYSKLYSEYFLYHPYLRGLICFAASTLSAAVIYIIFSQLITIKIQLNRRD